LNLREQSVSSPAIVSYLPMEIEGCRLIQYAGMVSKSNATEDPTAYTTLIKLSPDILKLAPRIQVWLKDTMTMAEIPQDFFVQTYVDNAKKTPSPLSALPDDVKLELFKRLDVVSATIMQVLNKKWRSIYKLKNGYENTFGAKYPSPLPLQYKLSTEEGGKLFMLLRTEMWRQAKLRWDPWTEKFVSQDLMAGRIDWVVNMPARERDERIEAKQEARREEKIDELREQRDERNEAREDARMDLDGQRAQREALKEELLEGARQDIYGQRYDSDEEEELIEELEREMEIEFDAESRELEEDPEYQENLRLSLEDMEEDSDFEVDVSLHASDSVITSFPFAGADHRDMDDWVWP